MRIGRLAAGITLVVCLGGCPPYDQMSWSPSGRYVALVTTQSTLAVWDTKTDQCSRLKGDANPPATGVHFIAEDRLIVLQKNENSDNSDIYERNLKKGVSRKLAQDVKVFDFAVSDDGAYLYYIQHVGELFELRQRCIRKDEAAITLYTSPAEIGGALAVSPSGKRVLFAGKAKVEGNDDRDVLYCLSLPEKEVRVLVQAAAQWVQWANEDTLVYFVQVPPPGTKQADGVGALEVHDIKSGVTKRLCENVYTLCRPSLNAERSKAVVTAFTRPISEEKKDEDLSLVQVVSVDLGSGEKTFLTAESFGGFFAQYDPQGNRIAYRTGLEAFGLTRILDLNSKRINTLWASPDEKLLSEAEAAAQDGKTDEASSLYQDFVRKFPESTLSPFVNYRLMTLFLRPDAFDLDKAYTYLRRYGPERVASREETELWRAQDQVATDPSDDLIRAYGGEASEKEFGFKTDQARDLLGLWVRQSPTRLYVRVDFNASQDVTGMALMDLVLLFHFDGAEGGVDQITPLAKWDRGAQRVVRFHHWYNAGDKSQYDVEILGPSGEAISRFQASGFADAQYPDMTFMDTSMCWKAPGSMVLSFSRKALGLEGSKKVEIQACTVKGGIEEFKKLERPRETPSDQGAFCDIADAFGADNTAARIDLDAKEKKTPYAVIKGCAGSFSLSE